MASELPCILGVCVCVRGLLHLPRSLLQQCRKLQSSDLWRRGCAAADHVGDNKKKKVDCNIVQSADLCRYLRFGNGAINIHTVTVWRAAALIGLCAPINDDAVVLVTIIIINRRYFLFI